MGWAYSRGDKSEKSSKKGLRRAPQHGITKENRGGQSQEADCNTRDQEESPSLETVGSYR